LIRAGQLPLLLLLLLLLLHCVTEVPTSFLRPEAAGYLVRPSTSSSTWRSAASEDGCHTTLPWFTAAGISKTCLGLVSLQSK
jgi:hypothetical protein